MNSKTVGSKNLYKLFMIIAKYIPLVLAIVQIIGLVLNLLGITGTAIAFLSFLGGTSVVFMIILYIFSYVFRFCYLYRIPLYYVTTVNILFAVKKFVGFTIETAALLQLHFLIAGVFIIIFIIYAYKNRSKVSNKIDYIKDLCERYCKCEN